MLSILKRCLIKFKTWIKKKLNFIFNIKTLTYYISLSSKSKDSKVKHKDNFTQVSFSYTHITKYMYLLLLLINYDFFFLSIHQNIYYYKLNFLNYIYSNDKYVRKMNYFFYFFRKLVYRGLLAFTILVVCILLLSIQKIFHFNKTIFIWFIIMYSNYLLYSGFVFFIKKYQFSKFTSAIQRYWRRTYIIFWLIETFLFLIFLYLTLNSNQEPFHIYDNIQVYKKHLFSWRVFLFKLLFIYIFIFINYYVLVSIKFIHTKKIIITLLITTIFLIYFIWLEFYQFFYILSYYCNVNWLYDSSEKHWLLENELKRTRMLNHYNNLCIILKFWHLVFIFFFWIFFIFRVKELNRIRYPLFSANLQNFIIFYIMAWIIMYPWLKYVFHKFLEVPYYWFFANNFSYFFRLLFNDLQLYIYTIFEFELSNGYRTHQTPFFYWNNSIINTSSAYDNKNFIKDYFSQNL